MKTFSKLLLRLSLSFGSVLGFLFLPNTPVVNAAMTGIYTGCSDNPMDGRDFYCPINNILTYGLMFAGAIIIIVIIVAGILYMTSLGRPTQVEKAKKTLVGAVISLIIIICSRTILGLLTSIIK